MKKPELFTNKFLTIQVVEHENSIDVSWKGKSVDREPSKFISPILVKVLEMAGDLNKRIIMDFQSMSYMNSSTITPIIKILETRWADAADPGTRVAGATGGSTGDGRLP